MAELELDKHDKEALNDFMAMSTEQRLREICCELAYCGIEYNCGKYATVQVTPFMLEAARLTLKELRDTEGV